MAMLPEWQSDGSLVQCLGHMMREGVSCDVTFLLGQDQEVVRAHKTILISRSPVFFAMLEGPLAEKAEITIPDITKSTFSSLLEYLYSDKILVNLESIAPLLYAARKYLMNRMLEECYCSLDKIIDIQNSASLLEDAHTYSEEELQQKCLKVIKRYPVYFFQTDDFCKLCNNCLNAVIDMNDLVVKEERVYEAVLRWSEAQCKRQNLDVTDSNRRQVLGDVVFAVRFPLMDETYFATEVCSRDILTSEEIVAATRLRHKKENVTYQTFKTERRCTQRVLQKTSNTAAKHRRFNDITFVQDDNIAFQNDYTERITMSPDWQSNGTLVECLGHMLKESVSADVTFLLGQDREVVRAHKTILISRSPVFYAMFEGPLTDRAEIVIPDISKNIFYKFLEYLYTDKVVLNVKSITALLYIARKYLVYRLVSECLRFLNKMINIQNAAILLEEAHTYSEVELQCQCLRIIKTYPAGFLKTDGFSKLCNSCVMTVVDMNDLVVKEERVYEAVLRWSEAQCKRQHLDVTDSNRRQVLGDVVFAVRFPLMDERYFNREVCHRDILTSEEIVVATRLRHNKGSITVHKFKTEKRCRSQLLKATNETDTYRQIKEITGAEEDLVIQHAISACQDDEGKYDVQDVISLIIEEFGDSEESDDSYDY